MAFFDVFPTFAEAPYSYIVMPLVLISSIIGFYRKSYFHALLLHPYEIAQGKRRHTLLTSAFVHRNWLHLLFNSFVIYGLGFDMYGCINQELGTLWAVVLTPILFMLLIILPNLIQTLKKKKDFLFTSVGASGLGFGLYGFSFLYFPKQKTGNMFFPWVENSFDYWIMANLFLLVLSFIPLISVNRELHLVGFLVGSVAALFVRPQSITEIGIMLQNLIH